MTHTMDYEGRDNFNTITLRAFSLLGLITVISGFTLAIVTTPKLMRFLKKLVVLFGQKSFNYKSYYPKQKTQYKTLA